MAKARGRPPTRRDWLFEPMQDVPAGDAPRADEGAGGGSPSAAPDAPRRGRKGSDSSRTGGPGRRPRAGGGRSRSAAAATAAAAAPPEMGGPADAKPAVGESHPGPRPPAGFDPEAPRPIRFIDVTPPLAAPPPHGRRTRRIVAIALVGIAVGAAGYAGYAVLVEQAGAPETRLTSLPGSPADPAPEPSEVAGERSAAPAGSDGGIRIVGPPLPDGLAGREPLPADPPPAAIEPPAPGSAGPDPFLAEQRADDRAGPDPSAPPPPPPARRSRRAETDMQPDPFDVDETGSLASGAPSPSGAPVAALEPPLPDDAAPADAAGAPTRLIVHVPFANGEDAPAGLRQALGDLTADVETRVVAAGPRVSGVRYFHPEDREAAQAARRAVAAAEGDWEVGLDDFTSYRPLPRRGTIEIWLKPDR